MKKKYWSALRFTFFLALALLLVWLAFRGQDWQDLETGFRHADYSWIGLSIICGVISHIARGYRWKILVRPLGYNIKASNSFYAVMVGYLGNLALPRAGELFRCGTLSKYEKIPLNNVFGTLIIERAIDMACLLLISTLVILFQIDHVGNFLVNSLLIPMKNKLLTNFRNQPWLYLSILAALVIAGIIIWGYRKKIMRSEYYLKVKGLVRGFVDGIKTIGNLDNMFGFLFYTLAIWVMYFLMAYVCFFSLDATSMLGISEGLTVLVFGSLGVMVPVQGGIGAYHWIISKVLVIYGIAESSGLVFATLVHAGQSVMVLGFGVFALIMLPLTNKTKKSERNQ